MNVSPQELFAQLGALFIENQMLRKQIAELEAKIAASENGIPQKS